MKILLTLALFMALIASTLVGCSGEASVSKEEQARYSDRDPSHIHAPPPGTGPGSPGGPPPGAGGPAAGK